MKTLQTRFHIAAQQNHITLLNGREPYVCICSCHTVSRLNSTKLAVKYEFKYKTHLTTPRHTVADLITVCCPTLSAPLRWQPAGTHTHDTPLVNLQPGAPSAACRVSPLDRCSPCRPPPLTRTPSPPLPYVSPLSPPIYGVLAGGLPTSLLRLPVLPRKAPRSIHRPLLHRLRHARTHARTG